MYYITNVVYQEAKRWLETISQNIQDGPRNMTMSQIQDLLTEKVSANYQAFVSSFTDVDYARIGVISKDDFREVLNKNFVRLSEEQVKIFFIDFNNLFFAYLIN
jgi:Ca2+-binding EF-hand superfamily protein